MSRGEQGGAAWRPALPALLARGRSSILAGAVALAIAGHVVGGGEIPLSCGPLVAALVLTATATWAAMWAAASVQSFAATFAALAVGQFAVEGLLSAPFDGGPATPPATFLAHAVSTLALGVLIVGADQVLDELSAWFNSVLPRWWRLRAIPIATIRVLADATPSDLAATLACRQPWSPRGPPQAV